ncbi:hypothetical protein [Caballeronia sp.]|uniref:hypothetical protein n=1 Tax=Caballeronia sp. TaxID=1931223 RepID=UPI003C68317E
MLILAVLRWIGYALGSQTIKPVLEQSQRYHLDLRRWQTRWTELARGVDTKLMTASSSTREYRETTYLLIRNSGDSLIDELQLCAEAQRGMLKFQETVHLHRLKPGEIFKIMLPSFPVEELWTTEAGVHASYESTEIFPIRITRETQVEEYLPHALRCHPTHDDSVNGGWQRWRGRLYSTKAIEDDMHELKMRLALRFCGQYGLLGWQAGELFYDALCRRLYRCLPRVTIYAVLTNRWILLSIIWMPLILRWRTLEFVVDDELRGASDLVFRRGDPRNVPTSSRSRKTGEHCAEPRDRGG